MGSKKRADLSSDIDGFRVQDDDFFVEVMGHDVNNLNQVILANLELLQESNRLEAAQDVLLDCATTRGRTTLK